MDLMAQQREIRSQSAQTFALCVAVSTAAVRTSVQ